MGEKADWQFIASPGNKPDGIPSIASSGLDAMRVVLGAWGIGSFLASHSEVWRNRFGQQPYLQATLPPMSAVFSGSVEPFPFVLASKIFIDSDQYTYLLSPSNGVPWNLDANMAPVLRDFEMRGILSPIAFRSLLKPKIASLLPIAESLLESDDLAVAARLFDYQ